MYPKNEAKKNRRLEPCDMIIFGVTGDLTARKLIPALYNLEKESWLPKQFRCIGFARRPKTDTDLQQELKQSTSTFSRTHLDESVWQNFEKNIHYVQGEFNEDYGFLRLKELLEQKPNTNRIFYLSVAPSFFPTIISKLKEHQLLFSEENESCWSRVIIEKPFGHDYKSAQELQKNISHYLNESQVYRIDHYLGKETVQNLMVFRFGNHIFESLWNNTHIENVQITVSEDLGIGRRGAFYEEAGQLRDVVQNHMMQLLSLVAMEPPVSLNADAIRNEKVKVLQSIRPIPLEEISTHAVRAQYKDGVIENQKVIAYRQEANVNPESCVETYVALKLWIDNWRWSGVPFYLRTGKRLSKRSTEIVITFKKTPGILFSQDNPGLNSLVIRIQPNEGISLTTNCKVPGMTHNLKSVTMDFAYNSFFGTTPPEAYERLLADCFMGDSTLFARSDEVLSSWKLLSSILENWEHDKTSLHFYDSGSEGPEAANELLKTHGHEWINH